jgi:hypothetical protein
MPRVTIKSGILAPDGREEELGEYLCDWPDCPNIATHVLGCIRASGLAAVMCEEHAIGTHPANQTTRESRVPPSGRA